MPAFFPGRAAWSGRADRTVTSQLGSGSYGDHAARPDRPYGRSVAPSPSSTGPGKTPIGQFRGRSDPGAGRRISCSLLTETLKARFGPRARAGSRPPTAAPDGTPTNYARSRSPPGAKPRRDAITGRDARTAGELRVARLAADGLTNRDIAQALFIGSPLRLGVTRRRRPEKALLLRPFPFERHNSLSEVAHLLRRTAAAGARAGSGAARRASSGSLGWRSAGKPARCRGFGRLTRASAPLSGNDRRPGAGTACTASGSEGSGFTPR
jgi:hypothetical protein